MESAGSVYPSTNVLTSKCACVVIVYVLAGLCLILLARGYLCACVRSCGCLFVCLLVCLCIVLLCVLVCFF